MLQRYLLVTSFILCGMLYVSGQSMTDCNEQVLPLNHALNTRIDLLPVHPNSTNLVAGIGQYAPLHPDFGTEWNDEGTIRQIGIPYNVVGVGQPMRTITFSPYAAESDPGPWPIPSDPYIETVSDWSDTRDGDRHMLIVDSSTNMLYEAGNAFGNSSGTVWQGGAGAVYDLNSNDLRPETWTSADAAGLPIFPLLIRYDEVEQALATGGEIPHAIRFTAEVTRHEYIWPARHYASSNTDPNRPAMGLRFRLKSEFDISGFSPRMQVILRTFKKYGIIMSDNGGDWFFQGTHDDRWDPEEIDELKSLIGDNFEAVDISPWLNAPEFDVNSAAVPSSALALGEVKAEKGSIVLSQNYPNPFNRITDIRYVLPCTGHVEIQVFDLSGREMSSYAIEIQPEGEHFYSFDGGNLTPGMYYYILRTDDFVSRMKKMVKVE